MLVDALADHRRVATQRMRTDEAAGVRAINLMSSPGAGKTTLLATMLRALAPDLRIGVIEGDIETSIDVVDAVFVNKVDLLPHLDVDLDLFLRNLRAVNLSAGVIHVSARTGAGVAECCRWVRSQLGLVA
jgi:Ni2+-binding GTPase involved in maturation of urease and hydrogenase